MTDLAVGESARSGFLLGFDIGGTKCAVVLGRLSPGAEMPPPVLGRTVFPTAEAPTPASALVRLSAEAGALLQGEGVFDPGRLAGVGISCGGPLDGVQGIVLSPPNLPGWDRVPVVQHFRTAFGAPTRLCNDADAGALAEWQWGAGRGTQHLLFLTFGTGMGAGLILNGQLYTGASGLAGEVGHLRLAEDGSDAPEGHGKRGSFEGFCSGGGIARLAGLRQLAFRDAPATAEAARAGDPAARALWDEVARRLGQGVALLIDVLNPERIVLGSIFARCEDLLRPGMETVISREALPAATAACRIVPAALGDAIGDYASLAVAAVAASAAAAGNEKGMGT